jgi:hypothetical protein
MADKKIMGGEIPPTSTKPETIYCPSKNDMLRLILDPTLTAAQREQIFKNSVVQPDGEFDFTPEGSTDGFQEGEDGGYRAPTPEEELPDFDECGRGSGSRRNPPTEGWNCEEEEEHAPMPQAPRPACNALEQALLLALHAVQPKKGKKGKKGTGEKSED